MVAVGKKRSEQRFQILQKNTVIMLAYIILKRQMQPAFLKTHDAALLLRNNETVKGERKTQSCIFTITL